MDTIHASSPINELAAALSKAQATIAGAHRNAANPFFKSRYADLASVWDAIREPLTGNGLSLVQIPSAVGNIVSVETILMHSSGQYLRGTMTATAKDDSPQAIGSIVSYLRRYAAASFCGVCPVDDDAEAAQPRGTVPQAPAEPSGYDEWLTDLKATEPQSRRACLVASKKEYRAYFALTKKASFDKIMDTRTPGEEG